VNTFTVVLCAQVEPFALRAAARTPVRRLYSYLQRRCIVGVPPVHLDVSGQAACADNGQSGQTGTTGRRTERQ